MRIREGKKTSVIIIAPGEMPSVNLATTLPLSYKVNPFKYNLIYVVWPLTKVSRLKKFNIISHILVCRIID